MEVAVLREHSRSRELGEDASLVSEVFVDLAQALAWKPQIVFIANPAPLHAATCRGLCAHQGGSFYREAHGRGP